MTDSSSRPDPVWIVDGGAESRRRVVDAWAEGRPIAVAGHRIRESASEAAKAARDTHEFGTARDDQTAALLFTSGSTGAPRGVRHSRSAVLRSAELFATHFELGRGDTLVCLAPVHAMSGLRSLVLPLVAPVDVRFVEAGASAQGRGLSFLQAVLEIEADVILCGPEFVRGLATASRWLNLPSRRPDLVCTGAGLDEVARGAVASRCNLRVANFYGLTETGGIVLAERRGQPRPGVLPPPCVGVTEHWRRAEGGADGWFELGIEGPNLSLGYLGQPDRSGLIVWTRDAVEADGEGGWIHRGRLDAAFKAADTTWIFPERLEAWLRRWDGVDDAVVRPAADRAARLDVVVQGEVDLVSLREQIRTELGPSWDPARLTRGRVCRNPLGKVLSVDTGDPS